MKARKRYVKIYGRWPAFFPYNDARVYGFDFLMRAEPDRIYACLACASSFSDEKVRVIWDAARGFFSESTLESHLRAILFSDQFSLRRMRDDLVLTDGGDGVREECPEKDHWGLGSNGTKNQRKPYQRFSVSSSQAPISTKQLRMSASWLISVSRSCTLLSSSSSLRYGMVNS